MIRPAAEYDNGESLLFGKRKYFVAFSAHFFHICVIFRVSGVGCGFDLAFRNIKRVFAQNTGHFFCKILCPARVNIIVYEVAFFRQLHICGNDLGIVRHYGTVIVIIAQSLVKII